MNKIIHWFAIGICFAVPLLASGNFSWMQFTIAQVLSALYLGASQVLKPTAPVI